VTDINEEVVAFEFAQTTETFADKYFQNVRIWVKYGPEKMRALPFEARSGNMPDFAFEDRPIHRTRMDVDPDDFSTFVRPNDEILVSSKATASAVNCEREMTNIALKVAEKINAFSVSEKCTFPNIDKPKRSRIVYFDPEQHLEDPIMEFIKALLDPDKRSGAIGFLAKKFAKTTFSDGGFWKRFLDWDDASD